MLPKDATASDYVAWANRVNSRWIVHHDLRRNAEDYLAHLAKVDPPRLASSCRHAHAMVEQADAMEDPKPWFYAGLFSRATSAEAAKFLAAHWLTKVVTDASEQVCAASPDNVSDITLEKIHRIRAALTKVTGLR